MQARTDTRSALPGDRTLVLAVLVMLAALETGYVVLWLAGPQQPPFDDFFGLWSFAKFAAAAGPAVYHPVALQAFQRTLDPSFASAYPCPYPPTFLLLLAPLALLPLAPAYVLWMGVTFAWYVIATLGRDWRSLHGLALLVAPTSLLTLVAGQNGFLSAALLIGGLRSLRRAPWLAGTLFGLLAYKPQFGLLVPVVLIASRQWRAALAAAITVAASLAVSSAVFGWSIWRAWLHSLPLYRHLLQANQAGLAHEMPTVMAGLMQLGVPQPAAFTAQMLVAAALAVAVWRLTARTLDERRIVAVVMAVVLATPYAFTYDMPMVTAALVIAAQVRVRNAVPAQAWEVAVVLLLFAVLVAMTGHAVPLLAPMLIGIVLFVSAMPDGSAYTAAACSTPKR